MAHETLPFQIGETAHRFRRAFDRRAAPLGVTRAQWRALAWLGRQPGMRQVELADCLDIEPITLCRIIDRLEQSGLVERRRDPADRRAWRLFLTPAGQPLVAELWSLGSQMAGEAFAGLSGDELDTLQSLLGRVRDNLDQLAQERLSA